MKRWRRSLRWLIYLIVMLVALYAAVAFVDAQCEAFKANKYFLGAVGAVVFAGCVMLTGGACGFLGGTGLGVGLGGSALTIGGIGFLGGVLGFEKINQDPCSDEYHILALLIAAITTVMAIVLFRVLLWLLLRYLKRRKLKRLPPLPNE